MKMNTQRFPLFPDPEVSASLYCSGRLSEVVERVLARVWSELGNGGNPRDCYLWFMRYDRGGEHIKIRLHGPSDVRSGMRSALEAAAVSFLSQLGPSPTGAERRNQPLAPPIDEEDRGPVEQPDRSLLWTSYRRSPIALGPAPLLDDDRYTALLTACLGESSSVLLRRIAQENGRGSLSFSKLQSLHLEAVTAALGTHQLGADERREYLFFHRDSLLRAILRNNRRGRKKMDDIREMFKQRAAVLEHQAAGLRQALRRLGGDEDDPSEEISTWRTRVSTLLDHLGPLRNRPELRLDLYTEEPLFPVLFKVLHLFANQLGLNPLNEAFSYHSLLLAAGAEESRLDREPDCLPPFLNREAVA